jgi:hypothetical protein
MRFLQKDHLRDLFRKAADRQTEIMVQNILGQGIDIHLLGLREACREVEGNMHEIFTDDCFKIANCFLLSTSQVPNDAFEKIYFPIFYAQLHFYIKNICTLHALLI